MSLWQSAERVAAQTPESRNRYVDLLRAFSIASVVLGHWIMAAPRFAGGRAELLHLLDVVPWSHWLTWGFQVMPVFFFVGGFSNGTSWDGAKRQGQSYAVWLEARLRRLLGPVIPLVLLWAALGLAGTLIGVPAPMIRIGSQVALVPIWFLAIYLVIVMCVPLTRTLWHRYGVASIAAPALLAVVVDVVFFNTEARGLGWLNYLFVWSAVHQLGYAWQAGLLTASRVALLFPVGLGLLLVLTQVGPYPTSLVGVPSEAVSNTTPPKLPLLALAMAQVGLLLTIEAPLRRWLSRPRVWTAVVLVNGLIMALFLWHSTAMMLVIGAAFGAVPTVLAVEPGSAAWWFLRPLWVAVFAVATLPLLLLFTRVERRIARPPDPAIPLTRLLAGACLLCGGLALLALGGVQGGPLLGLDLVAVCLPLVGGTLAGFGPHVFFRRRSH